MYFYDSEGNLTSPNYPSDYESRATCDYFIKIYTAASIELTIVDFNTEPPKDSLYYGPGATTDLDNGAFLDGPDANITDRTIVIQGNQAWLHFETDRNNVEKGFFISWRAGNIEIIAKIVIIINKVLQIYAKLKYLYSK